MSAPQQHYPSYQHNDDDAEEETKMDEENTLINYPAQQRRRRSSSSSPHHSHRISLSRSHLYLLIGYAAFATCIILGMLVTRSTSSQSQQQQQQQTTLISSSTTQLNQSHPTSIAPQPQQQHTRIDDASNNSPSGPTFDQSIFPTHVSLPWSSSSPSSSEATSPTTSDDEIPSSWYGPRSYSMRAYLPPHHLTPTTPRFLHLTDLHLEPAYDPEAEVAKAKSSGGSSIPLVLTPGVCRRGGEPDWSQSSANAKLLQRSHFPLGRFECDTPSILFESTLDFVANDLAGFVPGAAGASSKNISVLTEKSNAEKVAEMTKRSDEMRGYAPPSTTVNPDDAKTDATTLAPYDFVLLTGDLAAHFIANEYLHTQTLQRVVSHSTSSLSSHIRGGASSIFYAIGNTDLFPTNYIEDADERIDFIMTRKLGGEATWKTVDEKVSCHPAYNRLLKVMTQNGLLENNPQAQREFCQGGYYSQSIPHLNIRVVVLNTIPYSPDFLSDPNIARTIKTSQIVNGGALQVAQAAKPVKCENSTRVSDPFGQLAWLNDTLHSAAQRNEKVLISGHIPPGYKDHEFAWCQRYTDAYRTVLEPFSNLLLPSLWGDFSEDVMRLIERQSESAVTSKRLNEVSDAASSNSSALAGKSESSSSASAFTAPSSSSSPFTSTSTSTPITSVFVSPGLSPRKHLNPSVRIYYLEKDENAAATESEKERQVDKKEEGQSKHTAAEHESKSKSTARTSSATAISSSSPSYRFLDYTQWYVPLDYANRAAHSAQPWSWQYQYSFRSAYDVEDMSSSSISELTRRFAASPLLMWQYQLRYATNQPPGPTQIEQLCNMKHVDTEKNERCKRTGKVE